MSNGPDWGIGSYEDAIAPSLQTPAEQLVQLAAPRQGERAVDLGCGSGNATLPLLRAGAHVTAIDPSLRLLGVTAVAAADAGFQLATHVAGAESIPLPDGDADLVVSNFGVIFCPDPEAAFAEMVRITAPGGRIAYSAWLPSGAIADVATLMREAAGAKTQPAMPPVAREVEGSAVLWHEPGTFSHLIPGGEAAITTHSLSVRFEADSAEAWFTRQQTHHPMWMATESAMPADRWERVRAEAITVLEQAAPSGQPFAIESPAVVVELRPQR